ncbi:MAG: MoaD/ThiS family protein [Candidatus Bathyarchaeia archaeon]
MRVKIKFLGNIPSTAGKEPYIEIGEGVRVYEVVEEIFERYGLGRISRREDLGWTSGYLKVLWNGREPKPKAMAMDGDEVLIFSPLVGG